LQRAATGDWGLMTDLLRLVLLGDPVEHSLSPEIHRAALAASGMAGSYEARRVDVAGLMRAIDEISDGRLDGANVTMPHKRRALEGCAVLDGDARAAGAVNTITVVGGEVHGWNTDVVALRSALAGMPDGPVLVLGGGGAASAALVAGADRARLVAARREPSAAALGVPTVDWGTGVPGSVVVNATPLGMEGEPLPAPVIEEAAGLIDLTYGVAETPAVATMRGSRRPVVDGISVLVAQAAASFTIWTGVEAPIEAMEQAARSS
jgi:shikimate dehydrogenase